jgi:hypothetical protein
MIVSMTLYGITTTISKEFRKLSELDSSIPMLLQLSQSDFTVDFSRLAVEIVRSQIFGN